MHVQKASLLVLQLSLPVTMDSEKELLMEYAKMMTDMIVLCATLALSLFFWVLSLTISTYYGEPSHLSGGLSSLSTAGEQMQEESCDNQTNDVLFSV